MQKGYKHTKETREKCKLIALQRDNTKRIQSLPKGDQHWNYNPNPSKLALHKRLYRKYGKASEKLCVDCGKTAKDWSNETGLYTDKLEDYVPRCRKCHIKKDKNNRNGVNVWKALERNENGT